MTETLLGLLGLACIIFLLIVLVAACFMAAVGSIVIGVKAWQWTLAELRGET